MPLFFSQFYILALFGSHPVGYVGFLLVLFGSALIGCRLDHLSACWSPGWGWAAEQLRGDILVVGRLYVANSSKAGWWAPCLEGLTRQFPICRLSPFGLCCILTSLMQMTMPLVGVFGSIWFSSMPRVFGTDGQLNVQLFRIDIGAYLPAQNLALCTRTLHLNHRQVMSSGYEQGAHSAQLSDNSLASLLCSIYCRDFVWLFQKLFGKIVVLPSTEPPVVIYIYIYTYTQWI